MRPVMTGLVPMPEWMVSATGPMADAFSLRYSTKYFDAETGLYYYGRRFYSPSLMRWTTRDPIEEKGGVNLYAFCGNDAVGRYDKDGCVDLIVRSFNAGKEMTVNGVEDIFVDEMASLTLNGVFNTQIEINECKITLTLNIFLNKNLLKNGNPNTIYYFDPHTTDGLRGGASTSDNSPQVRGGILAHERGHAESFIKVFLPMFRREIARFGNKRLTTAEQQEVKRIYDRCLLEAKEDNAARSNQAHIDWYKNNGYRIERRRR